jgi:hypothetical protein
MDPIAWGQFSGAGDEENPTCEAAERAGAGDHIGARELLMEVLASVGAPLRVAISRFVKVDIVVCHCRNLSSTRANVEGSAAWVGLGITLPPFKSQARNKTNIEKQQ